MPNILLYERVPEAWFEAFAEFLDQEAPEDTELELVQPADDELDSVLSLLPEADVLVVGLAGQQRAVCRRVFADGERLRLVQKLGSRSRGIDRAAAAAFEVPVSLVPAPAHVACAEHTILLMLAAAKQLHAATRAIAEGHTRLAPKPTSATEYAYNWCGLENIGLLAGKTLGLVGMCSVAVEVARRAVAFGMNVVYYDPELPAECGADALDFPRLELDELLAQADVVSLHAAHTPGTENLINADRLARMKPTALLVNTARGGLIDEDDLMHALTKDEIAGAALDVWVAEPTPRDNPLLAFDSVVATPHIAAGSLPPDAAYAAILPNILAALHGGPVEGLLEPPPVDAPPEDPFEGEHDTVLVETPQGHASPAESLAHDELAPEDESEADGEEEADAEPTSAD